MVSFFSRFSRKTVSPVGPGLFSGDNRLLIQIQHSTLGIAYKLFVSVVCVACFLRGQIHQRLIVACYRDTDTQTHTHPHTHTGMHDKKKKPTLTVMRSRRCAWCMAWQLTTTKKPSKSQSNKTVGATSPQRQGHLPEPEGKKSKQRVGPLA